MPKLAESQTGQGLFVVIDADPDIGREIEAFAEAVGVGVIRGPNIDTLDYALARGRPAGVFLDTPIGAADAVAAIRRLDLVGYGGPVQIMAEADRMLADYVRLIGERHGLVMLPVLPKPLDERGVSTMIMAAMGGLVVARGRESRETVEGHA